MREAGRFKLSGVEKGGKGQERERLVVFTSVPTKADVGELNVAVCTDQCVGRVIIEIVERAKSVSFLPFRLRRWGAVSNLGNVRLECRW